ncbi:MAG: hypothetical protein CJBNEKGG_03353 [Prosthecobacter sp.]|nr:hypothetical protein [Prosthecobacter sp.]
MKPVRFLHKVRRTFVAMFWGWVAFMAGYAILAGLDRLLNPRPTAWCDHLTIWLFFGVYSVPVILTAWLLILLPVDCLVPESSWLRKPSVAALLGLLIGILPFTLLGTWNSMNSFESWWHEVIRCLNDKGTWLYLGGAGITGLTAALHIVLKHPRQPGSTG